MRREFVWPPRGSTKGWIQSRAPRGQAGGRPSWGAPASHHLHTAARPVSLDMNPPSPPSPISTTTTPIALRGLICIPVISYSDSKYQPGPSHLSISQPKFYVMATLWHQLWTLFHSVHYVTVRSPSGFSDVAVTLICTISFLSLSLVHRCQPIYRSGCDADGHYCHVALFLILQYFIWPFCVQNIQHHPCPNLTILHHLIMWWMWLIWCSSWKTHNVSHFPWPTYGTALKQAGFCLTKVVSVKGRRLSEAKWTLTLISAAGSIQMFIQYPCPRVWVNNKGLIICL